VFSTVGLSLRNTRGQKGEKRKLKKFNIEPLRKSENPLPRRHLEEEQVETSDGLPIGSPGVTHSQDSLSAAESGSAVRSF
jgi:hypothetical protein